MIREAFAETEAEMLEHQRTIEHKQIVASPSSERLSEAAAENSHDIPSGPPREDALPAVDDRIARQPTRYRLPRPLGSWSG